MVKVLDVERRGSVERSFRESRMTAFEMSRGIETVAGCGTVRHKQ
jgi:hypothetical protein